MMEIALIVLLFLVGTVVSAMQALKYLDRRNKIDRRSKNPPGDDKP